MSSIITFRELLEQPIQLVTDKSFDVHDYLYVHLSHLIDIPYDFNADKAVKVHVLQDFCYDGRRVWQLYYVTFKEQLVMFCYAAGREGQDSYSSRIFNVQALTDMVFHMLKSKTIMILKNIKRLSSNLFINVFMKLLLGRLHWMKKLTILSIFTAISSMMSLLVGNYMV